MKTIRDWNDLHRYGIVCLTGEACGLSARALCDLTDDGAKLVREFMGLPYNAPFVDPWNGGAVGSCFLPWDILPSLAAFTLITRDLCVEAIHLEADGVYGIETGDDQDRVSEWLNGGPTIVRQYRPLNAPRCGLSCVHAMSGRAQ